MEDLTTHSLGAAATRLFKVGNQLYLREHPDEGYTPVDTTKAIGWAQQQVDAQAGPGVWEVVSFTEEDDKLLTQVRKATGADPSISAVMSSLEDYLSDLEPLVQEAERRVDATRSYASEANSSACSAEYAADEADEALDSLKDKIADTQLKLEQLQALMDPS